MALMQREKARPVEREDEKPLLSANHDDMFDGLSFPEPPTAPPVVTREKTMTVPYNSASMTSYDAAMMTKPSKAAVLIDDFEQKTIIRNAPPNTTPQTVQAAPSSHNTLKSLYISERPAARGAVYPVLPEDQVTSSLGNQPSMQVFSDTYTAAARSVPLPPVNVGVAGDVEMKPWGKHTAAANTAVNNHLTDVVVRNESNAPTVIRASAPSEAASAATRDSGNLVHDLLDENARLKRQLEDATRGRTGGEMEATAVGPVVTGFNKTQRTSLPAATRTGIDTTTGTNPQQTQKYVCCGGCKQWLSAPRDANLVYCPGCEAVNDCSLAEVGGNRAVPRRLETQPWYTQCFQRFIG